MASSFSSRCWEGGFVTRPNINKNESFKQIPLPKRKFPTEKEKAFAPKLQG